MNRLYSSASNAISFHLWKISAPVFSMNKHPDVEEGLITPIYQPLDPLEFVEAAKSIVDMVNLREMNIPFEFYNKLDLLLVYNYINAYLDEVADFVHYDHVKVFLDKLLKLRKDLERGRQMIFREHPEWADRLLGLSSPAMKLLEQFNIPAGESIKEKQLSQPLPTTISEAYSSEERLKHDIEERNRLLASLTGDDNAIYSSGL